MTNFEERNEPIYAVRQCYDIPCIGDKTVELIRTEMARRFPNYDRKTGQIIEPGMPQANAVPVAAAQPLVAAPPVAAPAAHAALAAPAPAPLPFL